MSKLLYNTATQLLQPWPAGDADHVVGLESIYQEFEVIQNDPPAYNADTHHLQAFQNIVREKQRVERGWNVVENIPPPTPEATPLQVRAFLMRRGVSLESIPAYIAAVTAEGPEREEALMRWDKTLSLPKAPPLVAAVAASLNLDLDQVWGSILAIE